MALFLACHAVWVGPHRILFMEHRADEVSKQLSIVLDVLNMLVEIYSFTKKFNCICILIARQSLLFLLLIMKNHEIFKVK